MRPESFGEKLYIPRDIKGKPNKEELDTTRSLEEKLQQHESFVGLAPFGSWMSGYSSGKSDVDFYVLYDSAHESPEDFKNFLKQTEKELQSWRGKSVHCMAYDANPDSIIRDVPKGVTGQYDPYVHRLQAMTRMVTGKKINEYRKETAEKLHQLAPEEQQTIANEIFLSLSNSDAESFGKRSKRMPNVSEEDQLEVLKNRRDKWVKRIEQCWDIKPDQETIDRYDPEYTISMRPDYEDED